MLKDLILVLVLALIIGSAILYIVKAKKKGIKCIGCPMSKKCSSNDSVQDLSENQTGCSGNCSCCNHGCNN